MKGQATSRKPLSQAAMELLTTWRAEGGVAVQRSRRWGSHGTRSYTDRWNWPSDSSQHLFPSTRKDSKLGRTTKDRCVIIFMSEAEVKLVACPLRFCQDVVSQAIRRSRASFVPPPNTDVSLDRVRSHSGRHRCANDMKASGVAHEPAKRFARISSDRVWARYGRLSPQQLPTL